MKDFSEPKLAKLLNQIALGDNKAVEILYRHYQASVFAFIRLRVRDDAAAEEILNDTFMIAFQKSTQFNGSCEFKTWLCAIAKNVCGTWMRKQNTGLARSMVDLDDDTLDNIADPSWDVVSRLASRQMDEVLRECIDKLPLTHKEAFFWSWFEEEPLEEVAKRLDCPKGTIKSRLFNARSKIADCVKRLLGPGAAYAG